MMTLNKRFKYLIFISFLSAWRGQAAESSVSLPKASAVAEPSEPAESATSSSSSSGESEAPSDSDTKEVDGRLVHRSGESAAKNAAWLQFALKMRNHPNFADFRQVPTPGNIIIDPGNGTSQTAPSKAVPKLHLVEGEFDFRVAAYGYAQKGIFVDMVGGIPFRYLSSSDAAAPQGSEFGGTEFGLEGSPAAGVVLKSSFGFRSSEKFHLVDRHFDWTNSIHYQAYETVNGHLSVGAKFGPEWQMNFSQSPDAFVHYGSALGVMADLFIDFRSRGFIFGRLGGSSELHRALSYKIENVAQGGAGVFAVSPYIEFPVMDALWIGLRMDLPMFRPVGRELAFGTLTPPGLFGKSINFTVQAMNF